MIKAAKGVILFQMIVAVFITLHAAPCGRTVTASGDPHETRPFHFLDTRYFYRDKIHELSQRSGPVNGLGEAGGGHGARRGVIILLTYIYYHCML